MSEPELTPEAKDAIRAYMLKIVVPSAAVLTVVSGALGFVVSGLARLDASSTSAADARAASLEAIKASVEAKDSNSKAAEAARNAEVAQSALREVKDQTDKILKGQYDDFAKSLFATSGFREALGKVPGQQIGDLNKKLDSLSNNLGVWGNPIIERGNASEQTMDGQFDNPPYGIKAECSKPGMYVTGVQAVLRRGEGNLWGFRVVCRAIGAH